MKTAREFQQEMGSLLGSKDLIPWDLYTHKDKQYLINKIKLLMPDVPADDEIAESENKKLHNIRNALVTSIWNQTKYYGGDLLMSIVYIVWTKSLNINTAPDETNFTAYPLFRVRKCYIDDDSTGCCMIFIDDNSRVYQDWADYVSNNTLPEGVIVAPRNGVYNFNIYDDVKLESFGTPASGLLYKAGTYANKATVLGFGAAVVTCSALFLPIAAPVLAVSTVAAMGASIWGTGSSISRLTDRGRHEETMDPTDSRARAEWIGVAGGVIGLGAGGATNVLAKYAASGRSVSNIVQGTINGLNIASIAINGVGVGNVMFDMILKSMNNEEITAMDIAQLGVSLFLVTHSVYNFQTASKIISSSQNNSIESSRSKLSNRQRKAFDKSYKETSSG